MVSVYYLYLMLEIVCYFHTAYRIFVFLSLHRCWVLPLLQELASAVDGDPDLQEEAGVMHHVLTQLLRYQVRIQLPAFHSSAPGFHAVSSYHRPLTRFPRSLLDGGLWCFCFCSSCTVTSCVFCFVGLALTQLQRTHGNVIFIVKQQQKKESLEY